MSISPSERRSASIPNRLISLFLIYALLLQCIPAFTRVVHARTVPTNWNDIKYEPDLLSELSTPMPPAITAETITDAVVSRHKPTLNSGRIEGSLRVLLGESFTITNAISITSDVFLPGNPSVQVNNGAQHGGLIDDGGAGTPTNYTLTLANNANVPGHIHTRADAIDLPAVATSVPPAAGTRNVTVNSQSQVASIGDWQTVRDLNINGSHITVNMPPGNYGTLTINGNSQVNLSAGTYNFANTFNLDGSATLQATGAVVINVGRDLTINSGALTSGSYTSPADVRLNVLGQLLNIKGSSQVSALISAYNAQAKLGGTSVVRGRVIADAVTLQGGNVIGAVWPALSGSAMTVFGPRRFDRTSGLPNQYVEQFSLPPGTTAPYTLHIQNGSLDGTDRVSSATVTLNGVTILTQSDLNENVPSVERTVILSAQNQLDIRLTSDPGSYLIINITGTVPGTDTTAPLLAVTSPTNDSPTTANQIDVTGTASDPGQGASGIAHVYVNDVEASYTTATGTWTLTNVALALGANQLVVRAVDQAGNETTVTVNVTREAPENHSPAVDAGADQNLTFPASALLDGDTTDDGLPEGSSLTTTWSKVSGPGTVTFGDEHALSTTASFSIDGTYLLRLTASDGSLTATDDVTIIVDPQNQPPTVNAGANQTIALPSTATLNGIVTDDGLPAGNTLTRMWSKVSGPGTVTFEDPTLDETVATFSEAGPYVLRLTATDGELTSRSEVTITVHPQNQAPTVNAGADQTISLPYEAQLNGSASDDGWPFGSTLTTSWTMVSGPGTVTFAAPNVTVTSASFDVPGTYVLRLTASDGELSTSDDLTVVVTPPNQAPVVNAGADQIISLPEDTINLNGSGADDGLPLGSTLVVAWTKVSGPGAVIFGNANQAATTAQFASAGDYVLRLTASDGTLSSFDEVSVKVTPPNQAPTAIAGSDQTVVLPATAALNGSVSDDELPLNSTLSTTWSRISGPGTVTFANPNVTVTTATFSQPGTYVLRLTVTDSQLTTTDDITIVVEPVNQAPVVNAGADQTITLPASAVLHGTVTDDGYPSGSSVSVSWSKVSGPGTVTFSSPTSVDTNASFSVAGTYVLRLTASDSQLSASDDLQVIVIPQNFAPTANAGPDQTINLPNTASLNGSVSDDGLPAGSTLTTTWSKVSGPGDVTFANASVTVTTASFSTQGTYVLRLTANDSELTASDDITIVVFDPRVPPVANFIAPQTTGAAGGFVIAFSGGTGPDSILDSNNATSWTTSGSTNQFAKIQFYDQQSIYLDRVRLQAHQGLPGTSNVKDFEVQVSGTTSADASFVTVLTATYANNGQLQEFVFPGGAARARFVKFLPKNNHAGSGNILIGTFNPVAVGSIESAISLPGNTNGALSQSPALFGNGGFIHSFSYGGGTNNANGLLGYFNAGWVATSTVNQFAIIQLGGSAPATIKGVKLATGFNSGFGQSTAVKDFQVWVSSTTTDAAAFSLVLSASAPFVANAQTYLFLGGPVQARYVKYVPLTNHGGGATLNTQAFDVIIDHGARVVGVSGEFQSGMSPAEAAFDGDLNSAWVSPNNVVTNVWVKTALTDEVVQKLYGVRISPSGNISLQQGPKDFDIRVSTTTTDDSAFTTVFSGTVATTSNGAPQEFIFSNPVDAKYVQFFWKNGYSTSTIGVRELEALIYPTRGSAIVAFSSQDELASNCVDLDPTNQVWSTFNGQTTNQWLKLVMPRGELANINHMALRPAIAANTIYGAPKDFELQVSTTDAADSSFITVLSGTFANNTQLQDFYFPTTQARYVKLLLKNNYQFARIGVANFYVYSSDEIGTTTRFFDQSTDADGPIVSWAWDFGDGGTSSDRNPTHVYAQPGDYTVSLTVTDHTGLTHTRQTLYHVRDALRAEFTASPLIAHEGGELVRFGDVSKLLVQPAALRQYNFGDGSLLSQQANSSIHTFAENGTYQVTFKIGDPLGTSFTATRDVVVLNVAPTVDIPNGKTVVWGELWTSVPTISDQSVTDRLTLQGQWDFGDGQTSTCVNCTNANATVTHAYSTPGTYTAVLSITDRDGGTGSDSATYIVNKRATSLTFLDNSLQGPGQFRSRAKLTDTFANAGVANRSIQFIINGNTGTATTDATGVAEITLPIAANAITATISASFATDPFYLASSNSTSVTLNFAPTVNAGADQATTFPCSVTLNSTATDDGVPNGASLTFAWTKVSGPGNVTFSNPTALQTSASFTASGKYVLRLTASDSQLSTPDDINVTVNAVEVGPALYLGPTPYLSFADSPISGRTTTYFHLENFEDHLFNTPGVTASAGGVSSVVFGPTLHDSVDADDGVINGSGSNGDSYFTATGAAGITFTFNAAILGNLPTHAGLVWTDGAGQVFFEAFDRNGASMGVRGPFNFPDGSNGGTTAEDNFLGVYNKDGVSAIKIWNTVGGMEIDHLQYSFSTVNTPPVINAGPDQTVPVEAANVALNGAVSDDGLPACVTVTSTWSKVSGPGTVTFANAQSPVTTATISQAGIYVLRLTASDTQYTNSDDVVIQVTNNGNLPPTADAGPDQVISVPAKSVGVFVNNLAGFNTAAGTPPVIADFDNIAAGTDITGTTLSGVKFNLGNQSPSAPLIVTAAADTFTPSGFTGVINAATNKLIATSGANVLSPGGPQLAPGPNALVENDDLKLTFAQPVSAVGFDLLFQSLDSFSAVDVTILDSNGSILNSTTLSVPGGGPGGSPAGTVFYGFVSTRANIATVVIDDSDNNAQFPDSNIGFDTFRVKGLIPANAILNLSGSAFDDGQPPGSSLAYTWSKVSGPGSVTFENPQQAVTTASFSDVGSYTLRLTASDSQLSGSDDVVITVNQGTINRPPTVNAGPDQTLKLPANTVNLNANVTDDGVPAGSTVSVTWNVLSGPGNVLFGNSHAASTTATFAVAGTYVLRIVASDSQLTASDDIVVIVDPDVVNQTPTANAGPDQTATINGNLVANPGNEAALVNDEIPNWIEVQGTTWTRATESSGSGFPKAQRGEAYFFAGAADQAELRQDIDVSAFAGTIAAGTQQFELKAYLRSLAETIPDTGRVVLEYRNATNSSVIATLDSGPINTTTGWHLTEDTRVVPQGTGWIRLRLIATRNSGATNDAFFDSVSLRPVGNAAVKLVGAATDDGLPSGSTLSTTWTAVNGPATVAFANANSTTTGASFTIPGTYVLRLTSSDGQLSASDDVTVVINPQNLAPVVNAGANQTITLPATASLSGIVNDDGQPPGSSVSVNWSKVAGPGTVTFANANAAATTASFSAAGTYVLRLTGDDGEYDATADVTITVNPDPNAPVNQPPVVNPGPNQIISLPLDTVTLNGTVTDDGLPAGSTLVITWTKVSGPGNVTFGNANSAVTTAQFSAVGSYVLRLSASDGAYLVSRDVGVILTPENLAPTANAGADQTILLSQTAQLNGSASDDGLPSGNLTTTWSKLSGPSTVTFDNANVTITGAHFGATGTYVLRLTASDGSLSATDDVTITVNDNVAPPTVEITSPADGSDLTEPTPVTGSVSNGAWVLEYSLNSDDGSNNQIWTTVNSGTGPVVNGSLGTLDTTLMLNGIYSLRLKATDQYGQISFTSIGVVVEKNFKVGHLQLAFSDLNVPVAGLPIEVIRSYDSRDKRVGDFGVGWQLSLRSARIEKTGVLGFSWHQTVSSGFIPTYCLEPSRPHKVTVTFADGKVFKFLASTSIHCQQFVPVTSAQMTFTPEPGTHATLEVVGPNDILVETLGSIPGPVRLLNQSNPDIFNSFTFRLTTAEGVSYVINQQTGVSSIRDPYNNTLTINANGVTHSSGKSIAFTRDSLGRITQITDPNGNPQTYSYDANGDLVTFTDRETNPTTFTYNSDHHLLTIKDARGIDVLTNQYNADGRLIGQADAFNKSLIYDHDIAGRVETITDRLGHSTRYEYDERGNVLKQVDAKGGEKQFTYDELDNMLTETNEVNKTTFYTYDSADNRDSVKDPENNITHFTYNNARQVLTITDPRGKLTVNEYDPAGTNLVKTTDPLNNKTTFAYSIFTGQRTMMKDALDHETRYEYDAAGRLARERDPLGNFTTYGYDQNGNRTSQAVTRTNALGQPETITTIYTYDKLNRLIKTTFADSSFIQTEYNEIGLRKATIDQFNRRTEFTYDDMGRLTRTDYPDGTHDEATYDEEGRRRTSKDRAGRLTSYDYDELDRLTKTTYADGTFTSTEYDAASRIKNTTDARSNVTHYEYDAANRRTEIWNALLQKTIFTYDANGNQKTVKDALLRTTTFEYDDTNRRTKTIYHDNSFDTVAYDALGRVEVKTDQASKPTRFFYDEAGRLAKVKDALNQETIYTYDELGHQLTQTDANNHTTRFEYDKLGRRVKRILPAGQFESYAYDAGGNLQSCTDFNGKTTTFTYDEMRRMLTRVPDASLNQPTITFTYNANGQRATMNDASGATVYNYDNRNRLSSKQTSFGTLTYTYDNGGQVQTVRSSNANGLSVDYTYDELNRLKTVKDNRLLTLNGGVTSYNYDDVGNLDNYLYPNGVTSSYHYNSLNRLTSMDTATGAGTLSGYTYTLGPAGNRTAVSELGGRTVTYTYDDLYRLTNETIVNDPNGVNGSVGYGYDAVGNRLSRTSTVAGVPSQTSTFDANDRVNSDTYDNNGNTTASSSNSYAYDFENRLTSLNNGAVIYVYDGDGNRVAKTVGGVTTNYLVDTNNHTGYAQVVEELQGGNVVKQFTFGHDLISQRIIGGTLSFYSYDGHGSVRQLTDSSAAITDTYTYDAFGILITRTGTTPNDYLYTGEQFDANLGFYYLRARYMNPSNGRFLTQDTFEGSPADPITLHKYVYTGNNPVTRNDPSGKIFGTIVDILTSVNIQTILANCQFINGNAIMNQLLYGGNAGFKSLAIDAGFLLLGPVIKLTGKAVGRLAKTVDIERRFLPVIQKLCFVAGTLVQTKDGLVPIEKITNGTEVLSRNEITGKNEFKKVVTTFRRSADQILDVAIEGDERGPIGVTPEHPFYVKKVTNPCKLDEPQWVQAKDLKPGDLLLSSSGQWVRVREVTRRSSGATVYNFEVEENHNYFVGGLAVLVHNECQLFPNLRAGTLAEELELASRLGVKPVKVGEAGFDEVVNAGRIKWAITEQGELLVIPHTVNGAEISHAVLTGGASVRAAGEAEIAAGGGQYIMMEISNRSGHFQPSAASLDIGKLAFANSGVNPQGATAILEGIPPL